MHHIPLRTQDRGVGAGGGTQLPLLDSAKGDLLKTPRTEGSELGRSRGAGAGDIGSTKTSGAPRTAPRVFWMGRALSATIMANLQGRTAAPVAGMRGHLCTHKKLRYRRGPSPVSPRAGDEAPVGCSGKVPERSQPRTLPCPAVPPSPGRSGAVKRDSTRNCRAGEAAGGRQMRAPRETSKRRSDASGRGTRRWICPNMDKIAARVRQWGRGAVGPGRGRSVTFRGTCCPAGGGRGPHSAGALERPPRHPALQMGHSCSGHGGCSGQSPAGTPGRRDENHRAGLWISRGKMGSGGAGLSSVVTDPAVP